MDQETKLTLSVVETARLLGISRNLCYELVRRKELPRRWTNRLCLGQSVRWLSGEVMRLGIA